MTTSDRTTRSSGVLKLFLALALVVGVGLVITPSALAQVSGQYAPPTERFVGDIDRLDIDDNDIVIVGEDEESPTARPTSSGRTPVASTPSPGGSPAASSTGSGRVPLTASGPEAGKAAVAGKAKAGRSAVQGVLPATGGPLLSIILLTGLALVGTGMLVLRRFSGQG